MEGIKRIIGKLFLFLSLFSLIFLFAGCDWFNGNGDSEKQNNGEKQEVSEKKGESEKGDVSSVEVGFEEAYSSLVSPVKNSFTESLNTAKEFDVTEEKVDIDVSGNLKQMRADFNVNINIDGKSNSSFEDFAEVKGVSDIGLSGEANFMNPSTQKEENVAANGKAEIRIKDGSLFGKLKNLEIDADNPQFSMMAGMASSFQEKWFKITDMVSEDMTGGVNLNVNPNKFYGFLNDVSTMVEEKPLLKKVGKEETDGKIIYDIAIAEKNVVDFYREVASHDFMENVIQNSIDSQQSDISQEEIVENGVQQIKMGLSKLNFDASLEVAGENNIKLRIQELSVKDEKGLLNGEIEKEGENISGMFEMFEAKEKKDNRVLIEFNNDEGRFNFVVKALQNKTEEIFQLEGNVDIDYLENGIDSIVNASVSGDFGEVNIKFTDELREIEDFEVKKPEEFEELEEFMKNMMGGGGMAPGGGGNLPQQPQPGGGMPGQNQPEGQIPQGIGQ